MDHLVALTNRASALRQELQEIEAAIGVIKRLESSVTIAATPRPPIPGGFLTATDALKQVLSAGPLHKFVIREKLKEAGHNLADNTVTSTLSQKKKVFQSLGGGRWALL